MKTSTAFAVFILGLIMTMFGVGGVENSIATVDLLSSLAVSCVGLAIMYAATTAMQVSSYYDQR
jgi:hypothetical protein